MHIAKLYKYVLHLFVVKRKCSDMLRDMKTAQKCGG
jgi:hypothetical protein